MVADHAWMDKYDCPPLQAKVQQQKRHFAKILVSALLKRRNADYRFPLVGKAATVRPLFFVSAGRSGTTLLRSMLVAGGQIAIPPETQLLHNLTAKYLSLQHLSWDDLSTLIIALVEKHRHFYQWETSLYPLYTKVSNLPKEERSLARVIDEIYKAYAAQQFPDAVMWGDQSPIYTFHLPWITPVFPNAKFLHLVRDGRDTVASLKERIEKEPDKFRGNSLQHAIYRWKLSIQRTRELQQQVGSDQYLEVRYEDLVSDTEETLRKICRFAELDYTEKMIDYWKLPTTLEHKHHDFHKNIAKPVFTGSIGKWKERLTEEQQQLVLLETSELLLELGYRTND